MGHETTDQHRALVKSLEAWIYPWRRLTISIDGVDHSGKSTLARYLSWQLEMPTIETDLFLAQSNTLPTYCWDGLRHVIASRHNLNRPVIVEGVFVKEILGKIGVASDFSVYVECDGINGSSNWQAAFSNYMTEYRPKEFAHFVFARKGEDS